MIREDSSDGHILGRVDRALPQGFQLENYRILKVIAAGGFSIVYLAIDEAKEQVALKEYLPAALALRTDASPSPSVAADNLATFRYGMKCFFEEGKALSGLKHPNIVRVLDFFRANGTAYLAMRYERGQTLQEKIEGNPNALTEEWIRRTFAKLLNGLREVHSARLLHLDIKPGNIFVRDDGVPLLIDFGAALCRLATEGSRQRQVYTPGFASPEHYGTLVQLGPWSDIYSVGASMYACVAKEPPPAAPEHLNSSRKGAVRRDRSGRYSAELLDIIDWCLCLDPTHRPQSVFALQQILIADTGLRARSRALIPGQFKSAQPRFATG